MTRLSPFRLLLLAAVLSTPAVADDAPLADSIQTPGEIQAPDHEWRMPGEIRVPNGPWRVPGEIRIPTGPWLTPGEFQTPGAIQATTEQCRQRLIVGTDTLFGFDQDELGPEAEITLNALASQIAANPGEITIEGHTDAKGSDAYNLDLSVRRAESVRDWLVEKGAVPVDVAIRGEGEARPIAPNTLDDGSDNPDGRALNRRVEVVIATCDS